MRPLALLLLAVSVPAFAEVFIGRDGLNFSLAQGAQVGKADADLQVTPFGITAKYGVKREQRQGDLQTQEVTVLNEVYRVQDEDGGQWRMWVKTVVGEVVVVELVKAQPQPRGDRTYRAVSVTIDGKPAAASFAALTLYAGHSYTYGTVTGRYAKNDWGVTLDGAPGTWGRGAYTLNGEGLVFRFVRGISQYEVRYQWAPKRPVYSAVSVMWSMDRMTDAK